MNPKQALRDILVNVVPQWYRATDGPFAYSIKDTRATFFSQRKLTPRLTELHAWINSRMPRWEERIPDIVTPSIYAQITEEVALKWLKLHTSAVSWTRLIGDLEEVRLMTHENAPVSRNIVISPDAEGSADVTSSELRKALAGFAASTHTFLRVDADLRYLAYEEVKWSEVTEVSSYKFHPDFLHPFHCRLVQGEFSAHVTTRGDIVIMSSHGMLAAKRKGRWYIYEVATFKNFVGDSFGAYRVGCNLFDVLFDLSYRRHGALLVYDPEGKVVAQVSNKSAVMGSKADGLRTTVGKEVAGIAMGSTRVDERKKRLFLEAASMDGSIIFDKQKVLAFGAFIRTHPDADAFLGTRTTAAHSAFLWGGSAAKVSADGDINLFFKSQSPTGIHDARKVFL